MKTYDVKKMIAIVSLLVASVPSSSQEVVWCGVDKDTGQVNKYWCWASQANCEQGKPWQYICVAMQKPN